MIQVYQLMLSLRNVAFVHFLIGLLIWLTFAAKPLTATPSINDLLDVNKQLYGLVNCKIKVVKDFSYPDPNMPSTSKASQHERWYFYCEEDFPNSELPLPSPQSISSFGEINIRKNFNYNQRTIMQHKKTLRKLLTRKTFTDFEDVLLKLYTGYKSYQVQYKPKPSKTKMDTSDSEAEAEEKRKHLDDQLKKYLTSLKQSNLVKHHGRQLQNESLDAINAPFYDPSYDVNNNLVKYGINYLYGCIIKTFWGAENTD